MSLKDLLISDLPTFTSTDEFGVAAVYTTAGGVETTINVIFDNEFMAVEGVLSSDPVAMCKTSDIPNWKRNETLLIGGVTYYIREGHPDGTGMTAVLLSRNQT